MNFRLWVVVVIFCVVHAKLLEEDGEEYEGIIVGMRVSVRAVTRRVTSRWQTHIEARDWALVLVELSELFEVPTLVHRYMRGIE